MLHTSLCSSCLSSSTQHFYFLLTSPILKDKKTLSLIPSCIDWKTSYHIILYQEVFLKCSSTHAHSYSVRQSSSASCWSIAKEQHPRYSVSMIPNFNRLTTISIAPFLPRFLHFLCQSSFNIIQETHGRYQCQAVLNSYMVLWITAKCQYPGLRFYSKELAVSFLLYYHTDMFPN